MSMSANVRVDGVRDVVRELNRIEPGLRKEFRREADRIAKPAVDHARESYLIMPLSGMARKWSPAGRPLFPYDVVRARRNVRLRVDAASNAVSVIRIEQRDPGTAAYETAGRRTANPLGDALGSLDGARSRILGPAVYRRRDQVTDQMRKLVFDMMRRAGRRVA